GIKIYNQTTDEIEDYAPALPAGAPALPGNGNNHPWLNPLDAAVGSEASLLLELRKRHPTEPFIVMLKLARSGSILGHYFDPLNVVRATIGSTTPTVRIGSAHGKEP